MKDTPSMTGKTVLITGGTGGIGRAAAIGLTALGARVGITGRDRARAEVAAAAIARESGNPAVDVFVADMSSQTEVRRLAAEVLAEYPRLDVLLNNVGGFWAHRHVTADGRERTFALNHLAPFLLTSLLLERLMASAPARVVTVSSGAQGMGKIDFDDLMGERSYSGQRAYNQSKLANVMFTYELARRLAGTGVTATVLHPGMTNTAFSAEDPSRVFAPLVMVMRPFMRSPEKGATTSVFLASSADGRGSDVQVLRRRPSQGLATGCERHDVIDGQVARRVGRTLVARTPVTVLAMPGAEHAGAEASPGPRAVEGVVPAAVGLPSVLGAATTSAAGDDTTDRAQLHPRIVGELAGAVYSPAVLRRGDQSVPHNRQCGGDVAPTLLAAASPARDGSRRRSWGSTLPLWPGVTRRQWTSVPARKTLMPRSVATRNPSSRCLR